MPWLSGERRWVPIQFVLQTRFGSQWFRMFEVVSTSMHPELALIDNGVLPLTHFFLKYVPPRKSSAVSSNVKGYCTHSSVLFCHFMAQLHRCKYLFTCNKWPSKCLAAPTLHFLNTRTPFFLVLANKHLICQCSHVPFRPPIPSSVCPYSGPKPH